MTKLSLLMLLVVVFNFPAVAAERLPNAMGPEARERCQADPEACRAEMRAYREKRAEACRADPEKCRQELQAQRQRWCAENPEKCSELKARIEQRRAQCAADPEKCRQLMQVRLDERFRRVDADGNGSVSRAEAETGMPWLARRFDEIDANRDGQVSRDELESARKARAARRVDRLI